MDVTQKQLDKWQNGELIQRVFPHLTISQREFLMTGAWDSEWDDHVGEPEEEARIEIFEGAKADMPRFKAYCKENNLEVVDNKLVPIESAPQRTGTNIEDIPKDVADLMTSTMSLVAERMKEK
tara:strand:- start:1628 stop:1996 length:369 start_codon:yes stop_codon:yes gene_type:complete